MPGQDRSRWILTNRMGFLLLLASVAFACVGLFQEVVFAEQANWGAFLRSFPTLIMGVLTLLLTRIGKVKLAKLALIVFGPTLLIATSWFDQSFTSMDLLWMPVLAIVHPILPNLLYHKQSHSIYFWGAIGYCLILWLSMEPIIMAALPATDPVVALIQSNPYLYKGTMLFYYLLVNFSVGYLNRLNRKYEVELEQQMNEVRGQKELISQQHADVVEQRSLLSEQMDELRQQSEEIKQINDKLEFMVQQRTQELELQNHQLAEYAYINGHLLRGPLCRVQGLIYLMELSDKIDQTDPMYVHLRDSVDEFAGVVKHINTLVEDGKHFDRYEFLHTLPNSSDPLQPTQG